jgi:hypothetical protein
LVGCTLHSGKYQAKAPAVEAAGLAHPAKIIKRKSDGTCKLSSSSRSCRFDRQIGTQVGRVMQEKHQCNSKAKLHYSPSLCHVPSEQEKGVKATYDAHIVVVQILNKKNVKGRTHLEDLCADEMTILKRTLILSPCNIFSPFL